MAHLRPRVNPAQPATPGTLDGTGTASPPEDSYVAKLVSSTILVAATIAFPLIEKLLTKFGVKV
jgi:hypothetical protein